MENNVWDTECRREDYALLVSKYLKHNAFRTDGRRKNSNIDEKKFFFIIASKMWIFYHRKTSGSAISQCPVYNRTCIKA